MAKESSGAAVAEREPEPLTYSKIPDGGQFLFGGRRYLKRSGDRRNGGLAECLSDRSLDQTFFDLAVVQSVTGS